jgi:Flp pilus assembly protein TadD
MALSLGCSSGVAVRASSKITPEALLAGGSFRSTGELPDLVPEEDVLALNPEMRQFLQSHIDRDAGSTPKLQQLVDAIIDQESFGLQYDDTTRTAAQTFEQRRGNCLSFSSLFVAMAREVGLRVAFQEVDVPPDWTYEHDAYVLNRHVNVVVDLGLSSERVVDFNIGDFRASYDMRRISDSRAMAHFFNNKGVESLQRDNTATALACFRRAIVDCDRRFSPAWTSLGTLYLRASLPEHAEAAYLQALEADSSDLVAMSNLVALYTSLGDPERARHFRNKVVSHRRQNPYYRYHLAREACIRQDFESAIAHLKFAVRKRPQEPRFPYLLGLVYLQQGNERAGRRWLARAEEQAASGVVRGEYSNKIQRLLSANGSLPR